MTIENGTPYTAGDMIPTIGRGLVRVLAGDEPGTAALLEVTEPNSKARPRSVRVGPGQARRIAEALIALSDGTMAALKSRPAAGELQFSSEGENEVTGYDDAEIDPFGDEGKYDMDDAQSVRDELEESVTHVHEHTGIHAASATERTRAAARVAFLASRLAWLEVAELHDAERQAASAG